MSKFKLDDKVELLSKSYWGPLKDSGVYKRGKNRGYWYVTRIKMRKLYGIDSGKYNLLYIVDTNKGTNTGDYFLESDLQFIEKIDIFNDRDFVL